MVAKRFLGICAGVALFGSAVASDRDLEISYRPVFLAAAQPQFFAPMMIQCANKGRNTKGTFTITAGTQTTRYPIDLPQGSKKQFIAYMPSSYDQVFGILETDIGSTKVKFPASGGVNNCLVSISDAEGILNFVKGMSNRNQNGPASSASYSPLTANPDLLPDRSTGYLSVSGVFLSDGAERMGDAALTALQHYVLIGGTVVVTGGASTPLFNDPRWKGLLPVLAPKPVTLTPGPGESVAGLHLSSEFTMSQGILQPGSIIKASYKGKPFVVTRPYGFGRVVFIASNIFEAPVSGFQGKEELVNSLNLGETGNRLMNLQQLAMQSSSDQYRYGAPSPAYSTAYGITPQNDPFSASVPPTATVVWILILYFVLVVPLNLMIVRKLGRGELAWITSPILSLGFAAVFFRFAAGLYSADLSTATTGILVSDQRSGQSYFMGGSQMFFPRGGHYDLKLANVEGIRSRDSNSYYYSYGGNEQALDFDPVDNGRISVPDLSVSNLTFREFAFYQSVPKSWLKVEPDGKKSVRVTNVSENSFVDGLLYFEDGVAEVGTVKPGETKKVRLENSGRPRDAEDFENYSAASLGSMLANQTKKGRIAIVGTMAGFRPGPQIGNLVAKYTKLRLVWFGREGDS